MKTIRITNYADSGKILNYIHDRIFDLDKIYFDQDKRELSISIPVRLENEIFEKKFLFIKFWKNPIVMSKLIIRNVTSFEICDRDNLHQGCINKFKYTNSTLIVVNSIPVEIKLNVSDFEVLLEISKNVITTISNFSFAKGK